MARTAPTVNGTPTYQQVSLGFIDYTGDQRSIAFNVPAGVTVAQIEAAAEAIAAGSNASLFKISSNAIYEGSSSKSNATSGANHSSVFDNIVLLYRNPTTRATQDGFVPAPIDDLFLEGTDTPDVDPAGDLAGIVSAIEALLGAAAWNAISARFTERREINQREKF